MISCRIVYAIGALWIGLFAVVASVDAGVLCAKESGAVYVRETACEKAEKLVSLGAYVGDGAQTHAVRSARACPEGWPKCDCPDIVGDCTGLICCCKGGTDDIIVCEPRILTR